MNAKTDFQPAHKPTAIRPDSPQGRRLVAITGILGNLANLSTLQEVVNTFAIFLGAQSLEGEMHDSEFERALSEFADLARSNRAHMQSRRSTTPQS